MKAQEIIKINPIEIKHARIYIKGESDLVLNQMNARNERTLTEKQNNTKVTAKAPNVWEDIITSIHWYNGHGMKDTYAESTEEKMLDLLDPKNGNAPCITAFGLKKSFGQAVVRNEVDKYATKFDNAVNITAKKGLIPITFAEWSAEQRLMSPKKGSPVLVRLNHFIGWSAHFDISYTDNVYSLEQIANIINLAGFGLGIGSGRTSGYGRYQIVNIE